MLTSTLKILQWNCRGCTLNRLSELKGLICLENPSVVLLLETHWSPTLQPSFPNYSCLRKDRTPPSRGGGVAILIKTSLS